MTDSLCHFVINAMPSIYQLKQTFQDILRPIVVSWAKKGVTANQITIGAMLLSCLTGLLLYWTDFAWFALLLLPVVLFIRMALNAIDGMLAREHGMKSRLGAILNELGDVISDVALYLPFAWMLGVSPFWAVLFVLLAILTEMTGVIAVQIGASRRYDGPLGKSDRAFVMGALAFLLSMRIISTGPWLDYFYMLLVILSIVTIVKRSRGALRQAAK